MNRSGLIIAVVAALLVIAGAAYLLRPKSGAAQTILSAPSNAPLGNKGDSGGQNASPSRPSDAKTSPTPESSVETSSSLSLQGTVLSDGQATLSTRMPARIASVSVRQGEAVKQGQALVQLEESEARAQEQGAAAGVAAAQTQWKKAIQGREAQRIKADSDIAQARGALESVQTKLKQARLGREALLADSKAEREAAQEGVRKAQIGLERAQEILRGLEELAKVGGVARNDLEGARTQVKIAESDLATAKSGASRLDNGPRDRKGVSYRLVLAEQDIAAAKAGVRQAKAGLQTAIRAKRETLALAQRDIEAAQETFRQAEAGRVAAQSAREMLHLTSPLDGVVSSLAAKVGEMAQPGMPLLTVVSLTGLRVEALVPARQLTRLRVGQDARVAVDTQPGKAFGVILKEMAQVAEADGRSFRVVFRFVQPVALRPGQTARLLVHLHP